MLKGFIQFEYLAVLYENAPSLYSSPSTGEGGAGVIFILLCAPKGHGGLYEHAPSLYSSPSTGEGRVGVIFIFRCALPGHGC
ncbi:MAG: hypothetical protein COZ70_04945 [Deltaproteobacteria bacterium CG_4_8_14_3_um_filter_51_11]|nr:MAG: hypothetical protein AUK25_08380 [Desulfobacteraceae bacterium CG2_30_51_40]PIP46023.1 MAG: hypothetical protein COX16_10330 [Deltaproteobacteria bacterium CG23_combo_of_CG06-09_8_20_14_all_51_20]PIV99880.1 MAG: hypothetical protein COW41_06875 [Deltaproteobacteria bacterium CG17_big_fil_post_rev_8_21_14_2_50_51_6]PIX20185.1 MAG: hypothetical protein COZ70_04945 [Deltaproteobacteria bacterium CG_4_8_14_3_um_filter_51_11]PIY26929.1 MAG: hypothetical protein COZ11_01405 [Deltaproteobacter